METVRPGRVIGVSGPSRPDERDVTPPGPRGGVMKRRGQRCPAELTLDIIGGRWKVLIVWQLFHGARRFSELSRALEGITQKMLTQQLRELEHDGIVRRQVYAQVPP